MTQFLHLLLIDSNFSNSMINAFAGQTRLPVSLVRETETESDPLHWCNKQLAHIVFPVLLYNIIHPHPNSESDGLLLTKATLFVHQRAKK